MNVVSFSIWGDDQIYHKGLRENIRLARKYYPGWGIWVYCAQDVRPMLTKDGLDLDGKRDTFVPYPRTGDWDGSFQRFEPASHHYVDRVIVRDCDSRIGPREAAAVHEWIESGKTLHVMRDHIRHNTQILAGMWGVYRNRKVDMPRAIDGTLATYPDGTNNGRPIDQAFLTSTLWLEYSDDCMQHDSQFGDRYGETRPFPSHAPMEYGSYVGEKIAPDGAPAPLPGNPHINPVCGA